MGGGGGSNKPQLSKQEVTQTTSTLPDYAKPYFSRIMQRAEAESKRPYQNFGEQRIAELDPMQTYAQQDMGVLQSPGQFNAASDLAYQSGLGALSAGQYNPSQFQAQQVGLPNLQQYQMSAPQQVAGQQYGDSRMGTAQTGYDPNLQKYQMGKDQAFGVEQAEQYMSPYMQSVVDAQKRSAVNDAKQAQLASNLGSVRQGTYGGARELLATTQREKGLARQLGDIQAKGLQSGYESAQQQFERDRVSRFGIGQQNLQSNLQTQQLGTQTGAQTALANLSAEQQANVQNLASQLQTQGLNADQALRSALANQQAGLTTGQQNLDSRLQTQQLGTQSGLQALLANQKADLESQRMAEQSRQYGSTLGMQGYQQAGQAGQQLGQLGGAQQAAELARLNAQLGVGGQRQAYDQRYLDMDYADFLRQRDYPMERLGQYSNLMRGIPVGLSSTETAYGRPPSAMAQVAGAGLGALSLSKMYGG
tara:strand:+ start:1223 stop:2653 length:1431 start_codon:yes stop_codon:yes gene_type:complete